ncbi:MAG: Hsp20/alpha crystallin family protein [Treponema sp.]|nr:Hsp20/alpha crystallin family protein [Treponema sp.]
MKAVTLYRPGFLESALSGFDRYLDSFFTENVLSPARRVSSRLPPVDVREADSAYTLEAEIPGFDETGIEIRLDGSTLTIESKQGPGGETAAEASAEANAETAADPRYLIRERQESSFSRSFKLPQNADPEAISASFKNGILSLEIGKKPEAQARVIQVAKG